MNIREQCVDVLRAFVVTVTGPRVLRVKNLCLAVGELHLTASWDDDVLVVHEDGVVAIFNQTIQYLLDVHVLPFHVSTPSNS